MFVDSSCQATTMSELNFKDDLSMFLSSVVGAAAADNIKELFGLLLKKIDARAIGWSTARKTERPLRFVNCIVYSCVYE